MIRLEGETDELVKRFELPDVSVKLVNGKWSLPLGHPEPQYACHVRLAGAILSATRFDAVRLPYPSTTP